MMFVDLETRIPALINPYRSREYIPDLCAIREKGKRSLKMRVICNQTLYPICNIGEKNNKMGIKNYKKASISNFGFKLMSVMVKF